MEVSESDSSTDKYQVEDSEEVEDSESESESDEFDPILSYYDFPILYNKKKNNISWIR